MRTAIVTLLVSILPTAAAAADPDAPGPFAVDVDEYSFGDAVFAPPSLPSPVEIRGVIHSPAELDQGPFPLVLVLHGRHSTCYDPDGNTGDPFQNVSQEWPCFPNHEPIPSHRGYDYWAAQLASHGYVVASIGANGINAADGEADDGGALARAELLAEHLELWRQFATTDRFGTQWNGAVDLQNIGLVGHSRGGEGVATFVGLDAGLAEPFGIGAVLLLAPTDFSRVTVTGVPLAVVLPYCDGDVMDLQGVHYFDDGRYALPGDAAPKYVFTMGGSNHNFYNTVWSPTTFPFGGAFDDFGIVEFAFEALDPHCSVDAGGPRLDEDAQQASFVAYASAFLRTHLGHETEYVDLLRGDAPPPAAAAAARVLTSYVPPDDPAERLVVNRIAAATSLSTNDLGGAVQGSDLATYDLCGIGPGGGIEDVQHCVLDPNVSEGEPYDGREPHVPGLAQLGLAFTGDATWVNALPEGTDVSELLYLQLRAGVDFEDPAAEAGAVDFTIALVDRAGVRATTTLQTWTDALAMPPGDLYAVVPKLLLHGVRIPVAAFVDPALGGDPTLDLTDLASIELTFDAGSGAILVSDLAFVDAVPPAPSGTDSGGSESGSPDSSGGDEAADDHGTTTGDAEDTGVTPTDGSTGPGVVDGGSDGCGCRSGPRSGWGLLVLAVALRPRRRRGANGVARELPAPPGRESCRHAGEANDRTRAEGQARG
ncbi:MAG TPA: hypothetical protein VFG69_12040 [Nannocystaceae bacterium]|nr:hypothetical protein [Nannocystaceae bacterium]